ncbi:MAG: tetratricopeptide repeat protein [Planctomycetota bacterium]|nr:tetratricopeptide repeat protein [Planctomycetota bacterium]
MRNLLFIVLLSLPQAFSESLEGLNELYEVAASLHKKGLVGRAEVLLKQVIQANPEHSKAKALIRRIDRRRLAEEARRKKEVLEAHERVTKLIEKERRKQAKEEAQAKWLMNSIKTSQKVKPAKGEGSGSGLQAKVHVGPPVQETRWKAEAREAKAHLSAGRPEQALNVIRGMEEGILAVTEGKGLFMRASAEVKQREQDLASQIQRVREAPRDEDVIFELGYMLLERNRMPEAIKQYLSLVELNPNDQAAHVNLGYAYSRNKQLDKAEGAYRKALELAPDFAEAQNQLSYLLLRQNKKIPEAMDLADKAVSDSPRNPDYLHTLGYGYYVQSDYATAYKYFSAAAKKSDLDEVHLHKALTEIQLGKTSRARKPLERIANNFGEFSSEARAAIDKISKER